MTKKLCAALAVLALATCFGRVSAWAAGDPHAYCAGESSAPSQGPVVAECCATPAATHAVKPVSPELTFVLVSTLELAPSIFVERLEIDASGPPGPDTLRSAVSARGPPLA